MVRYTGMLTYFLRVISPPLSDSRKTTVKPNVVRYTGMLNYFLRIMRPPIFEDSEKAQTAAQLHYILWSGVGIAGGIAGLIWSLDNTYSVWTPMIPAIAACILALLTVVLRFGHVRVVSASIIGVGFVAITLSGVLNDGIRSSGMFILPLLLILTSVYLGKQATLWFGIGTLAMVVTLFATEYLDILETLYTSKPTHTILILGTGIAFSTFFLRMTVTRMVESSTMIRR